MFSLAETCHRAVLQQHLQEDPHVPLLNHLSLLQAKLSVRGDGVHMRTWEDLCTRQATEAYWRMSTKKYMVMSMHTRDEGRSSLPFAAHPEKSDCRCPLQVVAALDQKSLGGTSSCLLHPHRSQKHCKECQLYDVEFWKTGSGNPCGRCGYCRLKWTPWEDRCRRRCSPY